MNIVFISKLSLFHRYHWTSEGMVKCHRYRPILNAVNAAAPDCVLSAIRACWPEDPHERPNIMAVRTMLAPLQKGL